MLLHQCSRPKVLSHNHECMLQALHFSHDDEHAPIACRILEGLLVRSFMRSVAVKAMLYQWSLGFYSTAFCDLTYVSSRIRIELGTKSAFLPRVKRAHCNHSSKRHAPQQLSNSVCVSFRNHSGAINVFQSERGSLCNRGAGARRYMGPLVLM